MGVFKKREREVARLMTQLYDKTLEGDYQEVLILAHKIHMMYKEDKNKVIKKNHE